MSYEQNRSFPRIRPLQQAIVAGLSVMFAASTLAQSGKIEEILVTAQKRQESLQEVPIAISTLSDVTIERQGLFSLARIVDTIPSITQTVYPSSNMLIMYMRGQGVSDSMQVSSDGSVGLYLDGHYIARPQAAMFDIADTERVEVLRGPQGTLYGRNTTGGAINLISRKPTGEFGFKQTLSGGSRGLVRSLTIVDLPKMGDVSAKVSLLKHKHDGWVKNPQRSHDWGEEDELAGRVALHWDVSDSFTVDYSLDAGTHDSTPVFYAKTAMPFFPVSANPYELGTKPTSKSYRPVDHLDLSRNEYRGHGLTLTWEVNDNLTIKSLTGYRELDYGAYQSYPEAFGVPSWSYDDIKNYQSSQEFQFIGSVGDSIEYVAGLYYFKEHSGHLQYRETSYFNSSQVKDRDVDIQTTSKAIYGQVTWTPPILEQKMDLTLGGRYTWDRRKGKRDFWVGMYPNVSLPAPYYYDPFTPDKSQPPSFVDPRNEQGVRNGKSFSEFNPSFTASYNWNDNLSTYAKVVTGYKAGGSSEGAQLGSFDQIFDPEKVTSYELGLKSEWFDNSLRLNAAVFHSKFKDMQMFFVADPVDTSVIQGYNAGEANVTGEEIDLTWVPTADLSFTVNYAHMRQKIDKIDVIPGTIFDKDTMNPYAEDDMGPNDDRRNIKRFFVLPYIPSDAVHVSMDYTFWHFANADLSLNLNYRHQSKQSLTAPAGPAVPGRTWYQQEAFGLLNARLTLDMQLANSHSLQFALWGRNIANKEYRLHVIGLDGGGAANTAPAPGNRGYNSHAAAWAEPPTYGADVIFQW